MAKRAELSKGELSVAQAVWQLEEGSVGSIHEAVNESTDMDYTTVQTYLRRLESKGYLKTSRDGRNKIYRPKVQASQVISETVKDLVGRLFGGEVVAMVNHLVRDSSLSQAELRELRNLISDLETQHHER